MKLLSKIILISFLLFVTISAFAQLTQQHHLTLVDTSRNRNIPIEIYQADKSNKKRPIVIINHGYKVKNTEYSSIANFLAQKGYYVVSIQHELSLIRHLLKKDLYMKNVNLSGKGV